jgi:phospholipid-binding lipoprotein MlaA
VANSQNTGSQEIEGDWTFEEEPLYEDGIDDVYDPLEKYNRFMFKINNIVDKVLLVPVSSMYETVTPSFLQYGISNFTSNFFSPIAVINFTLQGDGKHMAKTMFRFIINTFLGFFGTVDVAKKMGLEKKETSLGDTFKKWGVKPGPYLVLPLLGSGSFRSGFGKVLQMPIEPITQLPLINCRKSTKRRLYYTIYAANIIVKRAALLKITMELEKTSSDMYITTRNAVMASEK